MQEEGGKKKIIALKAQEEKVVEKTKINDMEEDIALITKRVQKLMIKDKFSGRAYNKMNNYKKEVIQDKKEKREEAKEVICYKCKKSGHVKYDCRLFKAKIGKRRATMTT